MTIQRNTTFTRQPISARVCLRAAFVNGMGMHSIVGSYGKLASGLFISRGNAGMGSNGNGYRYDSGGSA